MTEPKLLPPSMRSHKRYIIFEIISEKPAEYADFVAAVWQSMLDFLGEYGAADAQIWIIKNLYDDKRQRGVIKCRHDYVEQVRTAIILMTMIGETKSVMHILGVTGTIKSAKTKYFSVRDLRDFQ